MENENCLVGIKCPDCGNEDKFIIRSTCDMVVTDDGWDMADQSNTEWNDDSWCTCGDCGKYACLSVFKGEMTQGKQPLEHVCPECGLDDHVDRLEIVPGLCGINPDSAGGWEYSGGWDPEYDDQMFSGIWKCCNCGHEWGELEPDLLEGLVGARWADGKKEKGPSESDLFKAMILDSLLRKEESHPIEMLLAALPGTHFMKHNNVIAGVLVECWRFAHKVRIPKDSKMVLRWVHEFFPPGDPRKEHLDFLAEAIDEVITERRESWESGAVGQSTSRLRRKRKSARS